MLAGAAVAAAAQLVLREDPAFAAVRRLAGDGIGLQQRLPELQPHGPSAAGRAEGEKEKQRQIALRMKGKGMSAEDIAELTGLSVAEVGEL